MRNIDFLILDTEYNKLCNVTQINYFKDGSCNYVFFSGNSNCVEKTIHSSEAIIFQFTGIHDKYGNKLYDGDIIKLHFKNGIGIYYIKYLEECGYFSLINIEHEWDLETLTWGEEYYEKIGHISTKNIELFKKEIGGGC